MLPSAHSISQYFTSFVEDPLFESLAGDSPYSKAQESYNNKQFEKIVPFCDEEISASGPYTLKAKLLKATFLILTKQLEQAFVLLNAVIEEASETEKKVKVNALVKRGSLFIQRCQDPVNDSVLSLADFKAALELEPGSADAFMNRGQINLLLDNFQVGRRCLHGVDVDILLLRLPLMISPKHQSSGRILLWRTSRSFTRISSGLKSRMMWRPSVRPRTN